MQVTDLLSGSLTSAAGNASATASEASNTIDRKDFLSLLVAQLQNQDPLNPLESAEFSSQLAQFSSLEQLMEINTGIEALTAPSESGQLDALSFLGHEVRATSGDVELVGGENSDLTFDLPTPGSVDVEITRGGVSLGTFGLGEFGAGSHALDLSDLDGAPPWADGSYSVTLQATGSDGIAQPVPTWILGQVTGVDLNGGDPVLLLGNRRVAVADVREIRTSGSATTEADEANTALDEPNDPLPAA